jgi:hypothetical protein
MLTHLLMTVSSEHYHYLYFTDQVHYALTMSERNRNDILSPLIVDKLYAEYRRGCLHVHIHTIVAWGPNRIYSRVAS